MMASRKQYKQAKGKCSFEEFLKGQRQINGSFYEALDEIMDALGKISDALGGSSDGAKGKRAGEGPLAATKRLVEGIPVIDPPGCTRPGGGS